MEEKNKRELKFPQALNLFNKHPIGQENEKNAFLFNTSFKAKI